MSAASTSASTTKPSKRKAKGAARRLASLTGDGTSAKFPLECACLQTAAASAEAFRLFALLLRVHHARPPAAHHAPPDLTQELLEIIRVQSQTTLADLLADRQRVISVGWLRELRNLDDGYHPPDRHTRVFRGFPGLGPMDHGFAMVYPAVHWQQGRLSVTLEQLVDGRIVTWTAHVDMQQVVLQEDQPVVDMQQVLLDHRPVHAVPIPDTAVTVETNVREHMAKLDLSPARVTQMESFKLTARFESGASMIAFHSEPSSVAEHAEHAGIGFKIDISCPWDFGKSLSDTPASRSATACASSMCLQTTSTSCLKPRTSCARSACSSTWCTTCASRTTRWSRRSSACTRTASTCSRASSRAGSRPGIAR